MSIHEIVVPDIGDSRDVEVSELLVTAGAAVAVGDALLVLESDKASVEVTTDVAGTIAAFMVEPGTKVEQGQVLVRIETGAAATTAQSAPAATSTGVADSPPAQALPPVTATAVPASPAATPVAASSSAAVENVATAEVSVLVPDIGDAKNVVVSELLVAPGATVSKGQALVVLESDKSSMEIESTIDGVLVRFGVAPGDEVLAGALIAVLSGATASLPAQGAGGSAQAASTAPAGRPIAPESASAAVPVAPAPNARALAPSAAASAAVSSALTAPPPTAANVYAGPAVRKMARELGVDLAQVTASGPRGRIVKDDVSAYVKRRLSAPVPSSSAAADGASGIPPIPLVDFAKFGAVEEVKLPRIQRAGGVNLHRSWLNLPHVTHFDEADITDLELFRKSIKDEAQRAGARVTPLAFLIKACTQALADFPKFNCSLGPNKDTLVLKRYCNIGIAVDTDNGLVVPVVRDADKKGVYALAKELVDLSDRARAGKLKPDEMSGGTFSITSLGVLGGTGFTPIINAPEVAILGVAKLATKPVWDGTQFVPREMLPLSLSYDHRVINGADAARFTTHLIGLLADLRRLLL